MKADQIIKNAKIYTSDKDMPLAAALAVKDGRFVYVETKPVFQSMRGRSETWAADSSCPV